MGLDTGVIQLFSSWFQRFYPTDAGMFGYLPEISDDQLAKLIRQNCRSGKEVEYTSNLYVAELLKKFQL